MKNKQNIRLTTTDEKGFARLKNPLQIDRAIGKLYEYEELGLSVQDIQNLIIRVENLTERVKALEEW